MGSKDQGLMPSTAPFVVKGPGRDFPSHILPGSLYCNPSYQALYNILSEAVLPWWNLSTN